MKLLIINGSIRQGRATSKVVKWVEHGTKQHQDAEWETVDLKELDLPLFDEPISPMMNDQRAPEGQVKLWLDKLRDADGYVFVTPEYNHAMGNGLKNAIDYIAYEVMKKPFVVVGHGGAGGARAVEQVKLTLNANIGAVPVPNSVNVFGYVGFEDLIDDDGNATSDNVKKQEGPLKGALETLVWYAKALAAAREA